MEFSWNCSCPGSFLGAKGPMVQVTSVVCSAVSDSLPPHGLQPVRHLCPWASPGKNTGVGCHSLLQWIFPTQGLNPPVAPALAGGSLPLSHLGSPRFRSWINKPACSSDRGPSWQTKALRELSPSWTLAWWCQGQECSSFLQRRLFPSEHRLGLSEREHSS